MRLTFMFLLVTVVAVSVSEGFFSHHGKKMSDQDVARFFGSALAVAHEKKGDETPKITWPEVNVQLIEEYSGSGEGSGNGASSVTAALVLLALPLVARLFF